MPRVPQPVKIAACLLHGPRDRACIPAEPDRARDRAERDVVSADDRHAGHRHRLHPDVGGACQDAAVARARHTVSRDSGHSLHRDGRGVAALRLRLDSCADGASVQPCGRAAARDRSAGCGESGAPSAGSSPSSRFCRCSWLRRLPVRSWAPSATLRPAAHGLVAARDWILAAFAKLLWYYPIMIGCLAIFIPARFGLRGLEVYGRTSLNLAIVAIIWSAAMVLLVRATTRRTWPQIWKYFATVYVTGFGTGGSYDTLPVNLISAERDLGLRPQVARASIVLGTVLNKNVATMAVLLVTVSTCALLDLPHYDDRNRRADSSGHDPGTGIAGHPRRRRRVHVAGHRVAARRSRPRRCSSRRS